MSADKLGVYNLALLLLEERNIASLAENREPRRVLDQLWTPQVNYCLEQGFWKHAKRVVEMPASTSTVPAFGYQKAIALPNDWINTYVVSASPMLDPPLLDYKEEAGFIFSNVDPVYLDYISNDPSYGWNLGKWTFTFTQYVAARLALMSGTRITKNEAVVKRVIEQEKEARRTAKGRDAMRDPPGFAPRSTWVRARRGIGWGENGTGSSSGGSVNMGPG